MEIFQRIERMFNFFFMFIKTFIHLGFVWNIIGATNEERIPFRIVFYVCVCCFTFNFGVMVVESMFNLGNMMHHCRTSVS